MKIYLFGQRNQLGGGVHFTGFTEALRRLNGISNLVEEVDTTGAKVNPLVKNIGQADVSIFFFPTVAENFVRGTVIKWGIFESDTLPLNYIDYLNRSHLIWVPSKWAKKILTLHQIDEGKIHVINEGVDPDLYHPFARPKPSADGVFRFLMCGKKETRKGFEELLLGFKLAFGSHSNVELHLKADHFWGTNSQSVKKKTELFQQIERLGLQNVRPIFRSLSSGDMAMLYRSYDAMIFPSRAEGWGLPLIEALASGLPVISTFYSGHTEYLSKISGKFIQLQHEITPINCPEYTNYWKIGGNWAYVEPEEIAKNLKRMKDEHGHYLRCALEASDTIRNAFSWRVAAEQAVRSLQSIGFCEWENFFDYDLEREPFQSTPGNV